MNEKELTNQESLSLITEMISTAKRNLAKGGSFYFLLWGWVVLLANLGHYLMARFEWYDAPYVIWIITIPALIASIVYSARKDRKAVIKSHLDRMYGLVWLAVTIGVIITLIFTVNSDDNVNALILTFAGVGTFITGCMLRFPPLIIGGVALWISSVIAFNVTPLDEYLVGAIGILAGYLIPGYLLKRAESEQV